MAGPARKKDAIRPNWIAALVILVALAAFMARWLSSSAPPPPPLPVGARLREGAHVTLRDQRLSNRLGLSVARTLACQATSSAGTRGWSADDWAAAIDAASAYRQRRAAVIGNMSSLRLAAASDFYDLMPQLHACGGRDPDAPPHGAALMRYAGDGDGGKWLCSLAELEAPCLIYSLGSWGDFKLEEALVASTSCDVWTFDCTVPPSRMPASLPPRVSFDPVCVGADGNDGQFQSLPTIMARLRHSAIHLLKMDIEGYEFSVIRSLKAAADADRASAARFLPRQIAVEMHLHNLVEDAHERAVTLVDAFQDLLDLNYVPVSREFNLLCAHCEEYVFIRLAEECFA